MSWKTFLSGSRAVALAQRDAALKRHAAIEAAYAALEVEADKAIDRARRDAKEATSIRVGAASQQMLTSPDILEEPTPNDGR